MNMTHFIDALGCNEPCTYAARIAQLQKALEESLELVEEQACEIQDLKERLKESPN